MQPLRRESRHDSFQQSNSAAIGMGFLNHLRFVAMDCRAKPKAKLFESCALLHGEKSAPKEAFAQALMRCLPEALGKPVRLLSPGCNETTFDEDWLMQLGQACSSGDSTSVRFLLHSRVAPEHRRPVQFLISQAHKHISWS